MYCNVPQPWQTGRNAGRECVEHERASLGVVGLDSRELVHAFDEGCNVRIGIEHGGRDAIEAPALEPAERGKHGAVSNGGCAAAEIAGS